MSVLTTGTMVMLSKLDFGLEIGALQPRERTTIAATNFMLRSKYGVSNV